MHWQVDWDDAAVQELADLWLNADDRSAVRLAAGTIDRELAWSPDTKGIEFYGDRLIVVPPLQCIFKTDEARRRATVLHIW